MGLVVPYSQTVIEIGHGYSDLYTICSVLFPTKSVVFLKSLLLFDTLLHIVFRFACLGLTP